MMADGKEVAQFPLVALQDVPEAGMVGRLWDSALLMVGQAQVELMQGRCRR